MSISTSPAAVRQPKLLERLADALHQHNYMPALIHDYVDWTRRFIFFHHKRHPNAMGAAEVSAFMDYLAADGGATGFQRAEAKPRTA